MRTTLALSSVLLFLTPAAAAANPTIDAETGWITADSPLYQVDRLIDDVLIDFGRPPGTVVHERASEALVAAEANDSAVVQRAVAAVNHATNRSDGGVDGDALRDAERVLAEVKDKVPADTRPGIQTAIDNVITAQNREPTARPH